MSLNRPQSPKPQGTETEAVIFDLDDTLILAHDRGLASFGVAAGTQTEVEPATLARAAVERARDIWRGSTHIELGRELGIASYEVLWATFAGGHHRLESMRRWAEGFRMQVWREALETEGGDPSGAAALAEAYITAQRRPHPVLPGSLEAARFLAEKGVKVGILTNGPPDIQRHKLSQLEALPDRRVIVISGEVGLGKPDRRVFELTLARLGSEAANTVMVGDSWNRDVEGAIAVGIRAVWISNGRPLPGQAAGVAVVDSTEGLTQALAC